MNFIVNKLTNCVPYLLFLFNVLGLKFNFYLHRLIKDFPAAKDNRKKGLKVNLTTKVFTVPHYNASICEFIFVKNKYVKSDIHCFLYYFSICCSLISITFIGLCA